VDALEEAFSRHGPPRHLISDQEKVFISEVLADLLSQWHVKHRFGAVGKHGSIAVTERVILTMKYEWLRRVPVIRGLNHLDRLLRDFAVYYNDYRGHTTLGGTVPAVMYRGERWERPEKSAKTLPTNLQRRVFADTQITAYRLAA
jgi:transposase InsO family protein